MTKDQRIEKLEERVRELEARPVYPTTVPMPYPVPYYPPTYPVYPSCPPYREVWYTTCTDTTGSGL